MAVFVLYSFLLVFFPLRLGNGRSPHACVNQMLQIQIRAPVDERYDFSKHSPVNPEMAEKHGVKMKKPGEVTLESEFEKIKKLDIDNWTNIRGPRPWEGNEQQKKSAPS